jgi:hypothetical protein
MLQQPEKDEEKRDLRWFPATKEEDCRVKQDFDEEVVREVSFNKVLHTVDVIKGTVSRDFRLLVFS